MPKGYLRYYFLFFGLLDAIALFITFGYSLDVIDLYFSYFTVLSNILLTAVFLYFGLSMAKTPNKSMMKYYGLAVLSMSITGIIFWTVLLHHHLLHTIPWINLTFHAVMPVAAVVGWFLFSPKKLRWSDAFFWQLFPLLFVIYTLIHGLFICWYPYPFLNPTINGYLGVMLWVIGLLTGSTLLSLLLILISHKKN